jgi:hypothetical protein
VPPVDTLRQRRRTDRCSAKSAPSKVLCSHVVERRRTEGNLVPARRPVQPLEKNWFSSIHRHVVQVVPVWQPQQGAYVAMMCIDPWADAPVLRSARDHEACRDVGRGAPRGSLSESSSLGFSCPSERCAASLSASGPGQQQLSGGGCPVGHRRKHYMDAASVVSECRMSSCRASWRQRISQGSER